MYCQENEKVCCKCKHFGENEFDYLCFRLSEVGTPVGEFQPACIDYEEQDNSVN